VEASERLFRVVMTAESNLMLMDAPDSDPQVWRFDMPANPDVRLVVIHDVVSRAEGWPRHLGLRTVAEVAAVDIDAAMDAAKEQVEMHVMLFAVAARAAVAPVHVQLAYEITPGIVERDFVRIAWGSIIPSPKRVVPRERFNAAWDFLFNEPLPDPRHGERITLSMSRYRLSLDESDPAARFLQLWLAAEAISAVVADHYEIEGDQGWQGLRRLADELGLGKEEEARTGKDFVSQVLAIRREIFHAMRLGSREVRARLAHLIDELDLLLVAAWRRLVPFDAAIESGDSMNAAPVYLVFTGTLVEPDESVWDLNTHPDVELAEAIELAPEQQPGQLNLQFRSSFTVRNAKALRPKGIRVHGSRGASGSLGQG
jgi:hypothetical protein